ncbi:LysR family transcriptional regulator [Salmonella enterica subsp. enterica]|uniref:LysR family transcriptional regulator n=1 Tax=Salmonella enterica I TaxID=59201 RepID=A0A3S5DMI8_SALET|nr:LysR family transcriptional regulator [Salmonella enterica subsp. enterica]
MSSSHHADLIAERFDVAIRLGSLADSRYRAALISRFTILPVAAPQWLARNPVSSLESLAQAEWIIHERLPTPLRWTVTSNHGQHSRLEISKAGKISVDSARSLMAFALAGKRRRITAAMVSQHRTGGWNVNSRVTRLSFSPSGHLCRLPGRPPCIDKSTRIY